MRSGFSTGRTRSVDRGKVCCRFDASGIDSLLQCRKQRAAKSGYLEVRPLAVEAASAQASVGAQQGVILGARLKGGQVYSFAVRIDEAGRLEKELAEAVASARKQMRETRQ